MMDILIGYSSHWYCLCKSRKDVGRMKLYRLPKHLYEILVYTVTKTWQTHVKSAAFIRRTQLPEVDAYTMFLHFSITSIHRFLDLQSTNNDNTSNVKLIKRKALTFFCKFQ